MRAFLCIDHIWKHCSCTLLPQRTQKTTCSCGAQQWHVSNAFNYSTCHMIGSNSSIRRIMHTGCQCVKQNISCFTSNHTCIFNIEACLIKEKPVETHQVYIKQQACCNPGKLAVASPNHRAASMGPGKQKRQVAPGTTPQ